MKPKFDIDDNVKFFKDSDSLVGKVISFAYDPGLKTFRYTFTAKQVNLAEERVDEAVRHCLESELVKPGTEPVLDKIVKPKTDEK